MKRITMKAQASNSSSASTLSESNPDSVERTFEADGYFEHLQFSDVVHCPKGNQFSAI